MQSVTITRSLVRCPTQLRHTCAVLVSVSVFGSGLLVAPLFSLDSSTGASAYAKSELVVGARMHAF